MIPNICYFIFGFKKQEYPFLFVYYLAVYSAYIVNNPDKILFYYHYEPNGVWWDKLKDIKTLEFIKIDIPTHIGNKIIKKIAHKADKLRMDLLLNNGGIYLDIDTICVKPWKELLNNDVVLGKESSNSICNAIMFTKKQSVFFKLWDKHYEEHFEPDKWGEASILLPYQLNNKYPNLITLKSEDYFFLPSWSETNKIFENKYDIPNNLITLHLWETISLKYLKEINGWGWGYENQHTLYGKLILNLLNKYIIKDKSIYYAHKSFFKKENNILICKSQTFLKKSKKHSSQLPSYMKCIIKETEKVTEIIDMGDEYSVAKINNNFLWNSQKDQDYWVIKEIFNYKKNGYFIDLAATDGKKINNTYLLEKNLNWDGICIEPNPLFHNELNYNRKCKISTAVVDNENDKIIKFRIENGGMGGIIDKTTDNNNLIYSNMKSINFKTKTLESILVECNAPKIIDYLSLDVGGSEYRILENFPFNKYKFLTITIEGPSQLLDILLFKNDYIFVRKSNKLNKFDSYYIHKSIDSPNIKKEPYTLSLRRTYIFNRRNVKLPNLHIVHRIDKLNVGDQVSTCSKYYSFEDYNIIMHDIYNPNFNKIKQNDIIILSGGGLINCLNEWNKHINSLLNLSENVYGWGIGFNKHIETQINEKINFKKFKLLGVRDYFKNYDKNMTYLPCSSCNLEGLKKTYKIIRKIGIIEHHHNEINMKELNKYDKINNETEINKLIKFIGETDIIITNTYHCLYFSMLLNKKIILYNNFSEKFDNLKINYIKYTGNLENDILKININSNNYLEESININNNFYKNIILNI